MLSRNSMFERALKKKLFQGTYVVYFLHKSYDFCHYFYNKGCIIL